MRKVTEAGLQAGELGRGRLCRSAGIPKAAVLSGRLAIVATRAQGLPVGLIPEERAVAAVGNTVVDQFREASAVCALADGIDGEKETGGSAPFSRVTAGVGGTTFLVGGGLGLGGGRLVRETPAGAGDGQGLAAGPGTDGRWG